MSKKNISATVEEELLERLTHWRKRRNAIVPGSFRKRSKPISRSWRTFESRRRGFTTNDVTQAASARALEVAEDVLARDSYHGKPLAGPYKGLYRFRVGDYRFVYSIERDRLVVFVLPIRHRRDVYRGLV